MAAPLRLFDLFGDFTAIWPARAVRERIGIPVGGLPSPATWLAALNNSVTLHDVRTAADSSRVAVEAKLSTTGYASYPLGWPLSLESMPDVLFQVQPFTSLTPSIGLLASVSDAGVELVLEGLPVEIVLPLGLVSPKPVPSGGSALLNDKTVGDFAAGSLDDLKIVYRETEGTSIFVHVRVHLTQDRGVEITTAVPISFEACVFSGLPVTAVHDFRLIPTPELAPDGIEWLRHPVTPWSPSGSGAVDGLFAFRALDLDTNRPPLKNTADALRRLNTDGPPTGSTVATGTSPTSDSGTEIVLADTVVPWWSPWVIPIPRHITVGLRRRILSPSDPHQVYDFAAAPVNLRLSRDPAVNLIIDSFFYRSQPLAAIASDLGLTFSAAIVFGQGTSDPAAFTIELGDHYTPRVGYRRQFLDDRTPAPGQGALASLNQLLHLEIAGMLIIDLIGLQIGYSLGKAIGEHASFGDSAEATVDLWVSMPPTGVSDDSNFQLRGLSGEKVAFAIEALGWHQGSLHFDGLSLPDGVVILIAKTFGIVIEELGVVAEQGASYFSITAGILLKLPGGFEGGAGVRRLRFRIAGDPSRPPWKLDGFFIRVKGPTLLIEAGGFFTDETIGDTRVQEFGLTGTVGLKLQAVEWVFGLDLLVGKRTSPAEQFGYFMIQAFFRGSIPIAWFELRGARVLFSDNMRPKLAPADPSSRDLRYFNWYKSSNPLTVPGDRRLQAWQAENGSWSFGIGVGASIAQLGKAIELGVFVLGLGGPTEGGVLIVAEVHLLASPEPVAFAAIEWDGARDRFSVLVGVALTPKMLVDSAPHWLDAIAKLTGTLYISNDPATFAIGRLADERTWLAITFEWKLWVETVFRIGLCVEIVGNGGPKGFGFVVRIEGGVKAGVVQVSYGAGMSVVVEIFTTGSTDYAVLIAIEAHLRIVLFGFLNFGISAGVDFRVVGGHPSRGELRAECRLETPWFLPDVTWELAVAFGQLVVEGLATSVQPLRSAAASAGAERKSLPVHVERFDNTWNGEGTAPVHSIAELRAPVTADATRLARFAANTAALPVPTDSTIPIEFSVAVNDKLGLGTNVAPNLGKQRSGDLGLVYELVGLTVRRRPRFAAAQPWTLLSQRISLTADFSDPSGVALNGSFAAQELTAFWDVDVKADGQVATKKLLLNAKIPFEYATVNPEGDEQLTQNHPTWPCCPDKGKDKQWLDQHRLDYLRSAAGSHVEQPHTFTASASWWRWTQPTRAVPGAALGTSGLVALCDLVRPETVARAHFDEDAAFVAVRLLWPRSGAGISVIAFNVAGAEIGRRDLGPGNGQFTTIMLGATAPIRRVEIRLSVSSQIETGTHVAVFAQPKLVLALEWAAYVGLEEYLSALVAEAACGNGTAAFTDAYSGKGKLSWLPNHEYEVAVTTRVTVAHPSAAAQAADVQEFVYFSTKGYPGLNAVDRVGAEIEPYVASAYAGGRGRLYQVEPVTIAFTEDYAPAVPLAVRPAGSSAERTELLQLALTARPEVATGPATMPFTAVGDDWLSAHRITTMPVVDTAWQSIDSKSVHRAAAMRSTDPMLERLAGLTQRPQVTCGLPDPRQVAGSLLVAPPQGAPDPIVAGQELWPSSAVLSATVRPHGSGHVERERFAAGDDTAFTSALDGGAGPAADWSVVDSELVVADSPIRRYAIFGETDWDHLSLVTSAAPDAALFGLGVSLPAGTVPSTGLFAAVERIPAGRRLVVYSRTGGGTLQELAARPLPVATDPLARITLEVTTFDDEVAARVDEVVVRVQRLEHRAGRCCLIAVGPARFGSLTVHGLDMYAFSVPVSRYRSFEQHIGSFTGLVARVAPDVLGTGSTTNTVAGLWTATQVQVGAAMNPATDGATRQALFDRWVHELGLALRDEVSGLTVSAVTDAAGTAALLLESPEPIDFTLEVTPTFTHRVAVPIPRLPVVSVVPGVREQLLSMDSAAAVAAPGAAASTIQVGAVVQHADGLRVELSNVAGGGLGLRPGGQVQVAHRQDDGTVRLLTGTIDRSVRDVAQVVVAQTAEADLPQFGVVAAENALQGTGPGTVAVVVGNRPPIIGRWIWTDEPVAVTVLQDRAGFRALLIPVNAGSALALATGDYTLTLALRRARWTTTDAPDTVNHYAAQASLSFSL